MKSFVILFFLISFGKISFSQKIDSKLWKAIRNKTVRIQVHSPDVRYDGVLGSAFIINFKRKAYLVTNYHLIPARDFMDTTKLYHTKILPRLVDVFFYSKYDINKTIVRHYPLYDSNNKRLFMTVSNSNSSVNDKSVLDLTFLPLGKIDESILLDTISIWDKKNKKVDFADSILICGFMGGKLIDNMYPSMAMGLALAEKVNVNNRPYLIYNINTDVNGASGAPVYMLKKKHLTFVGIQSAQTQKGQTVDGGYKKNSETRSSFVISKRYILSAISNFLKNER